MRDIALDEDGAIDFHTVVSDTNEVMQSIRIILETKLGEMVEAPELGLDRMDLLENNFNSRYAAEAIREALEQDSRVTVTNVSVTADFNHRIATAQVDMSIDGEAKTTEVALDVG